MGGEGRVHHCTVANRYFSVFRSCEIFSIVEFTTGRRIWPLTTAHPKRDSSIQQNRKCLPGIRLPNRHYDTDSGSRLEKLINENR